MGSTDLSALGVDLADRLDRVQVVDTGIETDLVHDDNARLLDLRLERADRGADIARRHDVRLALDRGLDDGRVVDVRHERHDEVVLRDRSLENRGVGNVERDGGRMREVSRETFGGLERAAGWRCEIVSEYDA